MQCRLVEQLGLIDAVTSLVTEVTRGSGVTPVVSITEHFAERVDEVAAASADASYRILQEALSNVVRHSGATQVRVNLGCDGDHGVMVVVDDGRGMAVAHDGACHVGLLSIRERAALCGGIASWGKDRAELGSRWSSGFHVLPRTRSGRARRTRRGCVDSAPTEEP